MLQDVGRTFATKEVHLDIISIDPYDTAPGPLPQPRAMTLAGTARQAGRRCVCQPHSALGLSTPAGCGCVALAPESTQMTPPSVVMAALTMVCGVRQSLGRAGEQNQRPMHTARTAPRTADVSCTATAPSLLNTKLCMG